MITFGGLLGIGALLVPPQFVQPVTEPSALNWAVLSVEPEINANCGLVGVETRTVARMVQ